MDPSSKATRFIPGIMLLHVTMVGSQICLRYHQLLVEMPVDEFFQPLSGSLGLAFRESLILSSHCGDNGSVFDDLDIHKMIVNTRISKTQTSSISVTASKGELTLRIERKGGKIFMRGRLHLRKVRAKVRNVNIIITWRTIARAEPWKVAGSLQGYSLHTAVKVPQIRLLGDTSHMQLLNANFTAALIFPYTQPPMHPNPILLLRGNHRLGASQLSEAYKIIRRSTNKMDTFRLHVDKLLNSSALQELGIRIKTTLKIPIDPKLGAQKIPEICEESLKNATPLLDEISLKATFIFYVLYIVILGFFAKAMSFAYQRNTTSCLAVTRVFMVIILVAMSAYFIYCLKAVRRPTCSALYDEENSSLVLYLFWTLVPGVIYFTLFSPLITLVLLKPGGASSSWRSEGPHVAYLSETARILYGPVKAQILTIASCCTFMAIVIVQIKVFFIDHGILTNGLVYPFGLLVTAVPWLLIRYWNKSPRYLPESAVTVSFLGLFIVGILYHHVA